MAQRLIPYEALKPKGIGYSKVHLYRLELADEFPRRVRLGRAYAWIEAEIDAYIETKIAERDGAAA
jgi:prophage regulatory protein